MTLPSLRPRASHSIHLRAVREDGMVTARCVRHLKTRPTSTMNDDLVITTKLDRVTCQRCKMEVVR